MVLVVDDEAATADTFVEVLNRNGYAAMAAYDGEDALEDALLMPPELVIADVDLPGMSGIELAIALKSTIPDCRFLLHSRRDSVSELPAPANGRGQEFELLSKPVLPDDLLAQVSACLKPRGTGTAASGSKGILNSV